MKKCGLVLTGGGARGAYQAGAISAVLEICHENRIPWPFKVISGISAGGINSCFLASSVYQSSLLEISHSIREIWGTMHSDMVFNTSSVSLTLNGLKWIRSLSMGTLRSTKRSLSLLNSAPLRETLQKYIDFERINLAMEEGLVEAMSMNMVNYTTGLSQAFYQTNKPEIKPWKRVKREGNPVRFTYDHIMATSAIPLVFPPIKIGNVYYGDGSLRDYTPLSPPIHLGAEKLFIVGVRKRDQAELLDASPPTPAKILSIILNGILLDGLDTDMERLERINRTVTILGQNNPSELKTIETFVVTPSRVISEIAYEESDVMPKTIQYLINGLGNAKEAADLISYILFEAPYTKRLIEMGREDVLAQKQDVLNFMKL